MPPTPPTPKGNRIKCKKCGAELESKHLHDFRECKCGGVALDGGPKEPRYLWKDGEWDEWIELLGEWKD